MRSRQLHCPQCGSRAASEVRFCRACGFSLDGVKELIVPDERAAKSENTRISTAFNQGLALLLVSLVAVIVLTLFQDAQLIAQIYVKIVAAILVLVGLARMFLPYVFRPGSDNVGSEPYPSDPGTETSKLPPRLSVTVETPATELAAASFDTSELIQPTSVTENTTKLLDRSRDEVLN